MSRSSEDPGEIHSLNSIRGPSLKILRDTVCTFSSTPLGSVSLDGFGDGEIIQSLFSVAIDDCCISNCCFLLYVDNPI